MRYEYVAFIVIENVIRFLDTLREIYVKMMIYRSYEDYQISINWIYISGDGESAYDSLDTKDDGDKGDIDNILGVQVMPTTFTVTQVQTVYATIPPSVITGPVDGIPATAIVDWPSHRYIQVAYFIRIILHRIYKTKIWI